MVLSLLQAFSAKQTGEISWDEYVHILLSRLGGTRNDDDSKRKVEDIHPKLRSTDPFGHSIWMLSNRMDIMEDISALEAVFKAYRHGTLRDVENKLAALENEGVPREGVRGTKSSLTLLACQERRPDVLKFLLDEGGFPIEAAWEREAERVEADKDPKTFDVLQQSRQFQYILERNEQNRSRPGGGCPFDAGGRFPVDW